MRFKTTIRSRLPDCSKRSGAGLAFTFLFCFTFLVLAGDVSSQEGEWIDLETIRKSVAPIAPEEPVATVEAGLEPAASGALATPAERPPIELPRRFHWQGKVRELGRVGYVFLGDYYFVEEHAYDLAEKAYRYAQTLWPTCGPILTRLDLLQVMTGDWLLAAEVMQVGFDEGLPPEVRHDYGLKPDTPLLSNELSDVPPVPAIIILLALEALPNSADQPDLRSPCDFLRGRLLSFLGRYDEALRALAPVTLDEEAEPWNFQAASQRADLYLATWRPELAYVNLLQALRLAGDHPHLLARISGLRGALALQVVAGEGFLTQEVVRVLGRREQGHWALSSPETEFTGMVEVANIEGESLIPGEATPTHLLYRGRDYWLLTLPLGSADPDWEPGHRITLLGFASR